MGNDLEIKNREKFFHDKRYEQDIDPREKLTKYYSITFEAKTCYRHLISKSISGNRLVLEYGCGTGEDIDFYKSLDCNFYGIDISNAAVIRAEKQALERKLIANYCVGDAESTDFESDFFDVIFGSGILHHLNLEKSLKELSRIVRENGSCIFFEPLGHNPIINCFRWITPKMRTPDEHPLLISDLKLMSIYFRKVSVRYFYCFSLGAILFRKTFLFERVYKLLSAIDNFFINNFSGFGRFCWISVICLTDPIKK